MPIRSRMPIRPWPEAVRAALLVQLVPRAAPVVLDQQVERGVVEVRAGRSRWPRPPPCLRTLVSASCTIRYAVSSTPLDSGRASPATSNRTGRPGAAHLVDQIGELVDAGLRHVLAARVVARPAAAPSSRRISASAWRPVLEMVSSACLAWSGAASST